jgi:Acetyltransferase (GNAT) domain
VAFLSKPRSYRGHTLNQKYRIRQFRSFSDPPAPYLALLECEIKRQGVFREPEWFEHLMRNFFDPGDEFCLYGLEEAGSGRPLLLAPLRYTTTDKAAKRAHVIGSISNPENYTTAALIFDRAVDDPVPVLEELFRHFRGGTAVGHPRRIDAIRIWPVELDSPLADAIHQALKSAGFIIQSYANSFNRFEDTTGLSYEAYFAQRSANMRYNVRRRQRALERRGDLELVLVTSPADLERAIPDYLLVSRSSWKSPASMFALETLQLMHLSAEKGCLRLGILRLDDVPVAVQFWIVSGGTAHCARLAYHETYKKLAVGVVLTNFMISHVLDHDHVDKLDYGFGRDEYKRGWMKNAREYHGFMAFNPATPLGRIYAFRHIQGRWIKRLIKRGLGLLGWTRFKKPVAEEVQD